MRRLPLILLLVAAECALPLARAQLSDPAEPLPQLDSPLVPPHEYGGIVTAQMSTSLGYLFATRFTESWSRQPNGNDYVLELHERSSPRFGTEALIENNDTVVFRVVLPRSSSAVEALAESAAEAVQSKLSELAIQRLLFDDADMAHSAY